MHRFEIENNIIQLACQVVIFLYLKISLRWEDGCIRQILLGTKKKMHR
jgi:hypothetical protein